MNGAAGAPAAAATASVPKALHDVLVTRSRRDAPSAADGGARALARVPRVMHIIWMQGAAALPAKLQPFMDANVAFARAHGWTLRVWDALGIEALLHSPAVPPHWAAKYAALPRLHQRVDLGRYVILYVHGGLSVDADARVVADPLASPTIAAAVAVVAPTSGCGVTVMSTSAGGKAHAWLMTLGGWRVHVNNAIILTTPRRPEWRAFIDSIPTAPPRSLAVPPSPSGVALAAALGASAGARAGLEVAMTTGPIFFTSYWLPVAARGGAAIVPSDILEPCGAGGCATSARTCVIHEHALSWLPQRAVRVVRALARAPPWAAAAVAAVVLLLLVVAAAAVLRRPRPLAAGVQLQASARGRVVRTQSASF